MSSKENSVGQVSLDLAVDTSDIMSSISRAGNKISNDLKTAFENGFANVKNDIKNITSDFNKAEQQIQQATEKIAEDVNDNVKKSFEETSETAKKVSEDIKDSIDKPFEETSKKSKKSLSSIFSGFKGKVKEETDSVKKMSSSCCDSFKKIGSAMVAAFSVKKIIDFGKQAIESAAEVNAENSQFAQTFGELQNNAESAMQRVADSSGIVQSRLQGVGTSIYAFAKTTGMDSANALAMMEEALQVTADSAAYYDRSLEDTSESLKSFLKGNYENDAALGLSCTETTRNAAANKLYGTSFINLSEAQKQLTLLQMVKDANKLSGALGQASRESDGWENVTGNLKESWRQLLSVIGQPILSAAVGVIKKITSGIQTLTTYAKSAFDTLSDVFGFKKSSNTAVIDAAAATAEMSTSTETASDNMTATAKEAQKVKKVLSGFDQLNILSSDDSSDTSESESSASTVNSTVVPTVNTSPAEKSVNNFFKNLKSEFARFYKESGISNYVKTISSNVVSGFRNVSAFVQKSASITNSSIERMRPKAENAISSMLTGFTNFTGETGVIFSSAFDSGTQITTSWISNNESIIGAFFDNIQQIGIDRISVIGTVFQDTADTISGWWNDGGKALWDSVVTAFTDIGTVFINVFNEWIMPIWDAFVNALSSAWTNCLLPIFQKIIKVLTKLWNEIIYPLWQNVLKPVVNWLVKVLGPVFKSVFNTIGNICSTVFTAIGDTIGGLMDSLGGLIDFISGVFTGDWKKAWKGICDFFSGIWNGIWGVIKGVINIIIDGINLLWKGIYKVVSGIVNALSKVSGAIGSLFGKDWSFDMPSDPPLIPKLAKGGLVKAPTLALVGDNPHANSDPEVVSPLSKLKDMINDEQSNSTAAGDSRILMMLTRIYDLLAQQENTYENNIYLDSERIERQLVKVRKRKARRYGGAYF